MRHLQKWGYLSALGLTERDPNAVPALDPDDVEPPKPHGSLIDETWARMREMSPKSLEQFRAEQAAERIAEHISETDDDLD